MRSDQQSSLHNPVLSARLRRRDAANGAASASAVGVDGQQTIAIPTLLIGGMADGYTDNVFRMLAAQPEAQRGSWKALVGPWGHDWPVRFATTCCDLQQNWPQ